MCACVCGRVCCCDKMASIYCRIDPVHLSSHRSPSSNLCLPLTPFSSRSFFSPLLSLSRSTPFPSSLTLTHTLFFRKDHFVDTPSMLTNIEYLHKTRPHLLFFCIYYHCQFLWPMYYGHFCCWLSSAPVFALYYTVPTPCTDSVTHSQIPENIEEMCNSWPL